MDQADWQHIRKALLKTPSGYTCPRPPGATWIRVLQLFPSQGPLSAERTRLIADSIDQDARLRAEFFRQLHFGLLPLADPIDTTQEAIAFLGLHKSRLLLISSGLQSAKTLTKSTLIHGRNFWAANQERALIAFEIARILEADKWTSFVAARIQDFCLPQLFSLFEKNYVHFLSSPHPLCEFETTRFGWNHATLAACALLDWGCPDELICTVLLHHDGLKVLDDEQLRKSSVAAVAIASLFPDPLRQVPHGWQQLQTLRDTSCHFDWKEIAAQVDCRFKQTEKRSQNHISLQRRLHRFLRAKPAATRPTR